MSDFKWVAVGNGRLCISHRPSPKRGDIAYLAASGCQRVVTLMTEAEGGRRIGEMAKNAGIAWTWIPVPNGKFPAEENYQALLEGVRFLAAALEQGQSIFIHCSAGIHRTGMLTYALLRWIGCSAEEALETLARLRDHTRNGIQPRQIAWGEDIITKRDAGGEPPASLDA